MGENIGTTATANLAAMGAGIEARRAALAHLLFNVFGVIWVLCVFYPFVDMVCKIEGYNPLMSGQAERLPVVLALFHTCFNVLNTAILIGFIPQLEYVVCKLLPEDTKETKTTLHYINAGLIETPEIAVLQAQKEIIHFSERMQRMFGMSRNLLDEKDHKEFDRQFERITKYEDIADNMEIEIASYLGKVSEKHLSDDTKGKVRDMLRQIGELESIGDSCYKIARTIQHRFYVKDDFTIPQYTHLYEMMQLVNEALTQMMVVISGRRENLTIDTSQEIEKDINKLRDQLKSESISELNEQHSSYFIVTYYNDIIAECEKLGDYVMNVVESRLGKRYLRFKGLQVNIDKKTVIADDVVVSLTRIEFELLCLLLSNKGQVFSRSQLMNSIWQGVIVTDRTVDVNMTRLRKKLGPYAQHIANRQGYGYYFDDSI